MRKLLISILSVMILGIVTAQASDFFSKPETVKTIKKGISNIKARLKENGIKLPYWGGQITLNHLATSRVVADFLEKDFGSLQNVVTNLQIPSGTISNKVDWATLVYQGNKYLLSSQDVYEYYYRLYQFASFRFFLAKDLSGNAIFRGVTQETDGNTAELIEIIFERDFYEKFCNGIDLSDLGFFNKFYVLGNRSFVRKSVFNYILFTGTMLNKLSDDSFAKKYFSKYERDWAKMRNLLNKIKEEDNQK